MQTWDCQKACSGSYRFSSIRPHHSLHYSMYFSPLGFLQILRSFLSLSQKQPCSPVIIFCIPPEHETSKSWQMPCSLRLQNSAEAVEVPGSVWQMYRHTVMEAQTGDSEISGVPQGKSNWWLRYFPECMWDTWKFLEHNFLKFWMI